MTFRNDIASTLRRRHRQLLDEQSFTPEHLACLERAAEMLEGLDTYWAEDDGGEAAYLRLLAETRRLRRSVAEVLELINITAAIPVEQRVRAREILTRAMSATTPLGANRNLLVIEVKPGQTRDQVETSLTRILDQYFGGVVGSIDDVVESSAPSARGASPSQEDSCTHAHSIPVVRSDDSSLPPSS